jgi:hypothetical protein
MVVPIFPLWPMSDANVSSQATGCQQSLYKQFLLKAVDKLDARLPEYAQTLAQTRRHIS